MDYMDYFFLLSPTVAVGLLAYYFFERHTSHLENIKLRELHFKHRKQSLPLRLQAYERLVLFLERISPNQLVLRMSPVGSDKQDYENLLVQSIIQEFEHNLTQQIYVSEECWNVIRASKNSTISLIRKMSMSENVTSAQKLREELLNYLLEKEAPSETGLAYVNSEVKKLWS